METTLLISTFAQINLFSKINDYFVSNEIQALCIGFGGATLIYFLILLGYLVKKRYENYAEAFFLSLSLGGALFMLSLKIFPVIQSLATDFILPGAYAAVLILSLFYFAFIPIMFKIVRKWNNRSIYVFED